MAPSPSSRDGSRLTRITITLPSSLVKALDQAAGRRGRSRYAAEAIAAGLRRDAQARALRRSESALAEVADQPDAMSLADWIDAIRRSPR
jgi:metal-responsive CopG/Arc/MetJ family transcriptional regulator